MKIESASAPVAEVLAPKVFAVAGAETANEISHNLYPDASAPTLDLTSSTTPVKRGAVAEFVHDVFPALGTIKFPSQELPAELLEGVAEQTHSPGQGDSSGNHSRTLDRDERNGVLAVLGVLAGSWLLAGFFKPEPAFAVAEPAHKEADPKKVAESH